MADTGGFYPEPESEAQKSVNAMSNYALHLEAFRQQFSSTKPDVYGVVNQLINVKPNLAHDKNGELASLLSQIGMTVEEIDAIYNKDGVEGLKAAVDNSLKEGINNVTALAKRMDAFIDSPHTTDDVAAVFLKASPEFFQQLGIFDAGLESLLPFYGNAVSAQAVDKLNLDIDVLESMKSIGFISEAEMNAKIETAQDNRNIELAVLGIVGLGALAKILIEGSGKIKPLFNKTKLGDKLISPVGRFLNTKFPRIADYATDVLRRFGLRGRITPATPNREIVLSPEVLKDAERIGLLEGRKHLDSGQKLSGGIVREYIVGAITKGRLPKDASGHDQKAFLDSSNPKSPHTGIDVEAPNGDLISVGGPAKGKTDERLNDTIAKLEILKAEASRRGVNAQAYYEAGNSDRFKSLIKESKKTLGEQNVFIFPSDHTKMLLQTLRDKLK